MNRTIRIFFLLLSAITFSSVALPQSTEHLESAKESGKVLSSDQIWSSLVEGNKRFINGKPTSHDLVSQRHALEKTQHPLVAVLSCSDSRVPPEVVFDQGLGDLFVVRVAGNSADPTSIGSLEYAVEHLGSVMIIVLGHQSCGAVKAACSGEKMPTSNLEAVVAPVTESCTLAKENHTGDSLIDFAVKDHVHRTAQELLARSAILKHAHDQGKLIIVEAYYSLDSGAVTMLK